MLDTQYGLNGRTERRICVEKSDTAEYNEENKEDRNYNQGKGREILASNRVVGVRPSEIGSMIMAT